MRLGQTDLHVSPLGIGTWAWGDRLFWSYGQGYGEPELAAAYRASIEGGITFFDTAEVYGLGLSEQLLGRFYRDLGRPAVLATKFMPLPWRWQRQCLLQALRESNARLGVPTVDLYQIHWPVHFPVSLEGWMESLADAVDQNLTRTVGISNYSTEQTRQAHQALQRRGIPLTSNQVEFSLVCRAPERNGLLKTCQELGVTLIAYSPLGMGILTGKYTVDNPPPGARGLRFNRERLQKLQPLLGLLRELGQQHGKTPAQVALNWVMCKGAIPIPGAKNLRQAQENAGALGWQLQPDQVTALDHASGGW
ncbi:MAG: aldo/keto reductase [Gloeomargaritaceae cyanobacterium C42_A2020_066]|nr:aldo/keto reductase [Gloeomargaritaceae cyanobacterium C42_A2020_066]